MKAAYSITLAPLAIKDKIIIGVGGGEFGIRGFVAAYDAKTGKEAWRFNTIPSPGRAGQRNLEERRLEDRRRPGLGDRFLRPGRSISPTGASAIPVPTGTTNSGPATTSTPTPSSRSIPTPAS